MIPIGIPDQKYKNSPTIVTSIGEGDGQTEFRISYNHPFICPNLYCTLYLVQVSKKDGECNLFFADNPTKSLSSRSQDEVQRRFDEMNPVVRSSILEQLPSEVSGLLTRVLSL